MQLVIFKSSCWEIGIAFDKLSPWVNKECGDWKSNVKDSLLLAVLASTTHMIIEKSAWVGCLCFPCEIFKRSCRKQELILMVWSCVEKECEVNLYNFVVNLHKVIRAYGKFWRMSIMVTYFPHTSFWFPPLYLAPLYVVLVSSSLFLSA